MMSPISISTGTSRAPLTANSAGASSNGSQQEIQKLTDERRQNAEIRQLQARNREVRAHERAHSNAGGRYAGNPKLTYQRGPDGILYAIGGEVPIDVSEIPGDPQATIRKMQVVRRAALAPTNPSAVDRAVAATASAIAAKAAAELVKIQSEGRETRGTRIDLLV